MTPAALRRCLTLAGHSLRVLDLTATTRAHSHLPSCAVCDALRAVPAAAAAREELLTPLERAGGGTPRLYWTFGEAQQLRLSCPQLCRGSLYIERDGLRDDVGSSVPRGV